MYDIRKIILILLLFPSLVVAQSSDDMMLLTNFNATLPMVYENWFCLPPNYEVVKMTGREGTVLNREYQYKDMVILITASLFDMYDEEGGIRDFYRRLVSGKIQDDERDKIIYIQNKLVYLVGGRENSKAYIAYESGVFAQFMGRNMTKNKLIEFLSYYIESTKNDDLNPIKGMKNIIKN